MAFGGEGDKRILGTKLWNWKKSFIQITILPEEEELKWRMRYV